MAKSEGAPRIGANEFSGRRPPAIFRGCTDLFDLAGHESASGQLFKIGNDLFERKGFVFRDGGSEVVIVRDQKVSSALVLLPSVKFTVSVEDLPSLVVEQIRPGHYTGYEHNWNKHARIDPETYRRVVRDLRELKRGDPKVEEFIPTV